MSSNVANKRQRLDSGNDNEEQDHATKENSILLLLDLPNGVFLRLVSFSDFSARMALALALACQQTRDEVETHEKKVYETIKSKHRVDETFDARGC